MKSSLGLPANRETEERDALALIREGFKALAMREGITLDALKCYQRQREFLEGAVTDRYRNYTTRELARN